MSTIQRGRGRGRGRKSSNQGPFNREITFDLIVDYENKFDSKSIFEHICSLNKDSRTLPEIQTSEVFGMLVLQSLAKEDYDSVLTLNGSKYNDVILLVSPFTNAKYPDLLQGILSQYQTNFNSDDFSMNLSNSRERLNFPLNMNFFKDLQFAIFYLGAMTRRENIVVKKLILDNNNIHKLNGSYMKTYLPKLTEISLANNPIENDLSDFNKQKIKVITESQSFNSNNNNDNSDDDSSDDDDDSSENNKNNRNNRNNKKNYNSDDDESKSEDDSPDSEELRKNDDQYHKAAPDHSFRALNHTPTFQSTNVGLPDAKRKEIQPFLDGLMDAYKKNMGIISEFYTEDAVFSLTFTSAPRDSPISILFPDNRNLHLKIDNRVMQTIGGFEIANLLRQRFANGFEMKNVSTEIAFVSKLFFAVDISGTVEIQKEDKSQEYGFSKSLIVIGKNGHLLISNDHMSFRIIGGPPH